MNAQTWRLEPIGPGGLAWFYLRHHQNGLARHLGRRRAAGHTMLEERLKMVRLGG